jgi:hypothetical protein
MEKNMSRASKILLAVGVVALVMATIHSTLNGFPDLSSWNPHNR